MRRGVPRACALCRPWKAFESLQPEFGDDHGVVRGPFPGSGFPVGVTVDGTLGQRGRGKNVVDPPADVPLEGVRDPVIPERVLPLSGAVLPEDVHQAQGAEAPEGLPDVLVVADMVLLVLRVGHVDLRGRHVEVAYQGNLLPRDSLGTKQFLEPPEEPKFHGVVGVVYGFTLGDVGVDHPEFAEAAPGDPGLARRLLAVTKAEAVLVGGDRRRDGHAVVGLLAAEAKVEAQVLEEGGRERTVLHLRLLEAEAVHPVTG